MKTADLSGALLDYWVSQCNPPDRAPGEWHKLVSHSRGATCYYVGRGGDQRAIFAPSSRWDHGGPIIEREGIALVRMPRPNEWEAYVDGRECEGGLDAEFWASGDCPLQAAMRAYVASKFGKEVPDTPPA